MIASADTDLEQPQPVPTVLRNDDEKTHLSFITDPTISTDVRSVVSGTAFNMDEKESIRPDESASVKGGDESDSASGQGSGGQQSQVASEAGKDGFRDQFQEVVIAKKALPLAAGLVSRIPEDTSRTIIPPTVEFQPQGPDEKLLDALENPKDRIFLLQLEQQVIAFVNNSKEQILSLPPSNSFCRLLAHRLGDYYGLSHTADAQSSIVRLGKTENTRLPISLKEATATPPSEPPAPQAQPALKIMRRKAGSYGKDVAGDDIVGSSALQSQAGSDTGASGTDLQQSPSKGSKHMTREEREAHYQATRDRIFGDLEESKAPTESSTAASRASSTTGKAKKQKKHPKDDDFETRTMFMMGYQAQQQQQQQPGFIYGDRPPHAMYGLASTGSGMQPQPMPGPYADASMSQASGYQHAQGSHPQMQAQQVPMGAGMQNFGQPGYPQPPMYNAAYAYNPQGPPMMPNPMQYYPANEYANYMNAPMMPPAQQAYSPGYQGWNQSIPMRYGSQEQPGYFSQPPQSGANAGMIYAGHQKQIDGAIPSAGRFNTSEYAAGGGPHMAGQQQAQWGQWQAPSQPYAQYQSPPPWQTGLAGGSTGTGGPIQGQKMAAYQPQGHVSGKPNTKKNGNKNGRAGSSELGKYDTSSLPPKPPAPMPTEQ